jgi:SNF2 family DNA or RNA helicase
LSDLPDTDKSVVFCRFKYDIRQIRARCGREVYELSGDKNELEEWKEAPEGAVLATQIQAGSMGISMVEAATCFFYSVGYSLGDYEQARARLHRPGQTRNVNFYHLVAEASIDTTVYKALKSKKDVVESVLEELRNAH